MKHKTIATVLAGAATVATVAAMAAPAMAAGPYVVRAGTKASGTVAVTGKTVADPRVTNKHIDFETSGGLSLGCTKGTADGSVKLGKSTNGKAIGKITKTTWTGCVGPANLAVSVTQVGTWKIDATGAAGAKVDGQISGVNAIVKDSQTNGNQCSLTVKGAAGGVINTQGQILQLDGVPGASGPLKISNVKGCFGLVSNGETAKFTAKYKLTNPSGKITIKKK